METRSGESVGRLENRWKRGHGVAGSGRQVTRAHTHCPAWMGMHALTCEKKRYRRVETKQTQSRDRDGGTAYLVANSGGAKAAAAVVVVVVVNGSENTRSSTKRLREGATGPAMRLCLR